MREGEREMKSPTQAEMAEELSELSKHMRAVSSRLLYVAGFNGEHLKHSMELRGAADTVAEWSWNLKRKKVSKKR